MKTVYYITSHPSFYVCGSIDLLYAVTYSMCLDDYTKLRASWFFEFQENHRYQIRILAKNEVGVSEPLETEEPYTVQKPTGERPSLMLNIILPVDCVYAVIFTGVY